MLLMCLKNKRVIYQIKLRMREFILLMIISKEKTMGRGKNKKTIIARANPRYAIKIWSVFTRINERLPRTNNFTEAWHKCLI